MDRIRTAWGAPAAARVPRPWVACTKQAARLKSTYAKRDIFQQNIALPNELTVCINTHTCVYISIYIEREGRIRFSVYSL